MIVFVDTTALFAFMVRDDYMHVRACANFEYFMDKDVRLLTSSYVIVETIALLHRRVGLAAVSDFQLKIQPLLEIVWVDAEWHNRALQRLLATKSAKVSLVDNLSFEVMEARGIEIAFAFDKHFPENGFTMAAYHDLDTREG